MKQNMMSTAFEVFNCTNEVRKAQGLPPFLWYGPLYQAAQIRALEIISKFSHDRPDGRDCVTVCREAGIVYSSFGENIAIGSFDAPTVVDEWMYSPGHRHNILFDNTFLSVGVVQCPMNCAYPGGTAYVQLFLTGPSAEYQR